MKKSHFNHIVESFFNSDLDNRPKTSTVEFMQKYNLSNPEYGNFYQAQYDDYAGILLAQIGFQA